MMLKLHCEKIGVEENEDLYDDLFHSKTDLQKLKESQQFLRLVRVFEKRKKKECKIVLFVKNFEGDPVDQQQLDSFSSNFLKEKWKQVEPLEDFRKIIATSSTWNPRESELNAARDRLKNKKKSVKLGNSHLLDKFRKANLELEKVALRILKTAKRVKKT